MTTAGFIRIVRNGDELAIHQRWNPDDLTNVERRIIARELRAIAKYMRLGQFEDRGRFACFPAKK